MGDKSKTWDRWWTLGIQTAVYGLIAYRMEHGYDNGFDVQKDGKTLLMAVVASTVLYGVKAFAGRGRDERGQE